MMLDAHQHMHLKVDTGAEFQPAASCNAVHMLHVLSRACVCAVLQVLRAYARFLEDVKNDPWSASKYYT